MYTRRGTDPKQMKDVNVTAPFNAGCAFSSTGITPISCTIMCSRKNCRFRTIMLRMSRASGRVKPFCTYMSAISEISPSIKLSISHCSRACSCATYSISAFSLK